MGIKKIPFSDLLKQELPAIARTVIEIVDKHDPELLKINDIYEMLKDQLPNIELLKQPYGAHPLTKPLIPARQQCMHHARAIFVRLELIVKEKAGAPTQAVANTFAIVKRDLRRLDLCRNEIVVNERITKFFTEFDGDAEMQTTFEDLNLMIEYDKLKSAHILFKELLMKRKEIVAARSKETTDSLTLLVRTAMENLIMQIKVAQLKNKLIDYLPLINEMNESIQELIYKVSRRKLYNKRKADGLLVDGSDNESTDPEVESIPMMKRMGMETMSGNGFENGFEEGLDQKKTVASSSKLLQQPTVKKEA